MSGGTDVPNCGLSLIGYRGAGKTSVGRAVARMTGRQFIDIDERIVSTAGRAIADLFATDPEFFRNLEQQVLARLVTRESGSVIATGGGAVLRSENRTALRSHGVVVWLKAAPSTLAARLLADTIPRPSLTGRGTLDEIEQVLAERTHIYSQCSHVAVETDGRSLDDLADEVAWCWRQYQAE